MKDQIEDLKSIHAALCKLHTEDMEMSKLLAKLAASTAKIEHFASKSKFLPSHNGAVAK